MQVDPPTLLGYTATITNQPFYTTNYGRQTTGTDYTWIDPFATEAAQTIDPLDTF